LQDCKHERGGGPQGERRGWRESTGVPSATALKQVGHRTIPGSLAGHRGMRAMINRFRIRACGPLRN